MAGVIHLKPCSDGRIGKYRSRIRSWHSMADVLNPERTESTHLNTELQTPTLDAPADHFDPSEDPTPNPQAEAPSMPHRVIDPRPVSTHAGGEETELTGMEDFAAALE